MSATTPTETHAIRVVIVDDHPCMLEALEWMVHRPPTIKVVGLAKKGHEALALVRNHQPDLLLLDFCLPDLNGLEVAQQVRVSFPAVAVLIFAGVVDQGQLRAIARADIQGYMSKSADKEELRAAVRLVAAGRRVEDRRFVPGVPVPDLDLAPREEQVLRYLALGLRNTQIASMMDLSIKTVEAYITRIFTKLDVRTRTEAVRKAHNYGLVLLSEPLPESRFG